MKVWAEARAKRPRRRWRALTVGVLAAGLAMLAVFGVVPDRLSAAAWGQAAAQAGGVRLMSFNILRGGRPAGEALDAIAAADPDLVCLQELTPDLAKAFTERLSDRYPHRLFAPYQGSQGIGIASRLPLDEPAVLTLGLRFLPAAAARIDLPRGAVRVACIHLIPPQAGLSRGDDLLRTYEANRDIRLSQVERLLTHLDAAALPAVILGDMNEWAGQAALTALADAGFGDACEGPGGQCGPTWPGRSLSLPAAVRIDHILGRDVEFADAAVLEAGGSDHYPVVARIPDTPNRQPEQP